MPITGTSTRQCVLPGVCKRNMVHAMRICVSYNSDILPWLRRSRSPLMDLFQIIDMLAAGTVSLTHNARVLRSSLLRLGIERRSNARGWVFQRA